MLDKWLEDNLAGGATESKMDGRLSQAHLDARNLFGILNVELIWPQCRNVSQSL